jgi:hypothetical protein
MFIRPLIVIATLSAGSCVTNNQDSAATPETNNSDPSLQDPLVDPEVMSDRPIEPTTLDSAPEPGSVKTKPSKTPKPQKRPKKSR